MNCWFRGAFNCESPIPDRLDYPDRPTYAYQRLGLIPILRTLTYLRSIRKTLIKRSCSVSLVVYLEVIREGLLVTIRMVHVKGIVNDTVIRCSRQVAVHVPLIHRIAQ